MWPLLIVITGLIAIYRINKKKNAIKDNQASKEPMAVADFEKSVNQKVVYTTSLAMYMHDDHQLWIAITDDYIRFADSEIFLSTSKEQFQLASRSQSTLSQRRLRISRLELKDPDSKELLSCRIVISKRDFDNLSHYIKSLQ